ncbi:hypothetical protein G6F68_008225 [Rhizopus microsporus]|nr:hypothetical protein G6F69_005708 [Rhizopus microsporus]KAG1232145.1 hypothetical protein G6F67_005220 [Rhizopus microsporus]KAG1259279.1 hypothetical protein G6F68_008225 [Rhizopus microsporus]
MLFSTTITRHLKNTCTSHLRLLYRSLSTVITADDFIHKVDLRVGKITEIENHPDASHLYIEKVCVSKEPSEERTIVSGLVPYMSKDSLYGKRVVVVANLKASKFRGVLSQGMLLAASVDNHVQTLSPPSLAPIGERILLEGVSLGEPVDVLKPKQKIFEQVAEHLKTDENGVATYKGIPLVTSEGPVCCEIKHGEVS